MGDSLNYTNDDGQTAHGDGDSIHEESVVTCLVISDGLQAYGW